MAKRMTASDVYDYYESVLDRIYLSHHTYPTNIPNYRISAAEAAEQSEADGYGRMSGGGGRGWSSAGHKCTVFHRDPNFCNGLPRKGR